MQTFVLEFSENDAEKVRELIKEERTSVEALFLKALNLYVYQKSVRKIRRSLKPYAEKIGIYTEEDLFNEIS